uniref:Uncharacterized protein n=1 Tax=Ditylenchus dipsaci TaxID=166011 RepID=A0A915D4Z9_9BILA
MKLNWFRTPSSCIAMSVKDLVECGMNAKSLVECSKPWMRVTSQERRSLARPLSTSCTLPEATLAYLCRSSDTKKTVDATQKTQEANQSGAESVKKAEVSTESCKSFDEQQFWQIFEPATSFMHHDQCQPDAELLSSIPEPIVVVIIEIELKRPLKGQSQLHHDDPKRKMSQFPRGAAVFYC